ncbi:MAG: hypothetical protein COB60_01630 [Flavobacteriaceae bacterium]|nr:MAG: hypothetical protein COB60_01630 [Flavobacteriaceae bacterium]
MSKVEDFLTKEEEQLIIASIQKAEKNTSGEIRVHIEKTCEKLPVERAQEVFYQLKMETTAAQNGVLFYVAVDSKQFAIVGDVGIDKVVPNDFWESVKDALITEFKNENYLQGIVNGIEECGLKLKTFFPYQSNDENELPDEISKG